MRTTITCIFLLSIIYSCSNKTDTKTRNNNGKVWYKYTEKSNFWVDSTELFNKANEFKITTAMNIPYAIWSWDIKNQLNPEILLVELEYYAYACVCPRWHISQSGEYKTSTESKEAIYIEAMDSTIDLEANFSNILNDGNRFILLGRFYSDAGYPNSFIPETPNAKKARVFRYYSFKILDPFLAIGPKIKVYDNQDVDSISILTKCIKNVRTIDIDPLK